MCVFTTQNYLKIFYSQIKISFLNKSLVLNDFTNIEHDFCPHQQHLANNVMQLSHGEIIIYTFYSNFLAILDHIQV